MEVANSRNHSSKRKFDDTVSNSFPNTTTTNIDLSLLEAVEKSQTAVEALDLRTLKKLVLSFKRRFKENIEARLKSTTHSKLWNPWRRNQLLPLKKRYKVKGRFREYGVVELVQVIGIGLILKKKKGKKAK